MSASGMAFVNGPWPPKFLERTNVEGSIVNISPPDSEFYSNINAKAPILPSWYKLRPMERIVLHALVSAGGKGMSMAEFFMTYRISRACAARTRMGCPTRATS
jgi:hypothetical protein